ncbi:MAG TPA: hypothetical protein VLR93_09745 [Patescibacteria group bacterium]|nr:hypothetical protein [Patescibacteria group bacterium]
MPYLPHTRSDHDETLIARLAVDDLASDDRDRLRATTQVAECPACAELLADLRTIATAVAALPEPRRTRDFRVTEADAARLRPTGWRGALARLGSPSFAFTRPLAAGLATLGIAGLLITTLPTGFGGSAASMPESAPIPAAGNAAGGTTSGAQDSAGQASAAPAAPAFGQPAPTSRDTAAQPDLPPVAGGPSSGVGISQEGGGISKGGASPGAVLGAAPNPTDGASGRVATTDSGPSGGPSPFAVVSILLLLAGVALAVLRTVARRLA